MDLVPGWRLPLLPEEKMIKPDKTVDCVGLYCPMPVVKTRLELEKMTAGQVLEVIADDPGAEKDIPSWCQMTGQEVLGMEKKDNLFYFYIRKKPD